MKKKIWMAFCVLACMLLAWMGFTGTDTAAAATEFDETVLGDNTQALIEEWFNMDFNAFLEEYAEQLNEEGNEKIKKEYESYAKLQTNAGAYKETQEITYSYEQDEDGNDIAIATAQVECENDKITVTATYDATGSMKDFKFKKYKEPKKEPKSAIMKRAGLNTVMSMAIVFAVLILIAFVISAFVLISILQNRFAKEQAPIAAAPAVNSPTVQPEEEDLTDDLELVAVISAAIAASSGQEDTSGFVVRSIRRVGRF